MNINITVLLLSGGTSSRFWPLTHKMSQQFLGKSFLDRQIEQLKDCGFKNIVVVSNTKLGTDFSSSVPTVVQKGNGQGAAILSAATYIKTKPILVINADDLVSPLLYKKILEIAGADKNILVGYKTKRYFPGGYLVLNGKKIAHIVEKPGEGNEPSSFVRLVCDYFPSSDVLFNFLNKIPNTNADTHYEDTLTAMMKSGEFFEMLEYEDVWIPVKYPWQALTLMDHYLAQIKKSTIAKSAMIHETATISGPVFIEEGVRVLEYAKLTGPLYIGKNSIIGNHSLIRYSIVGKNSVIGFGSDVTRSYLGSNVWLHSNYIGDSVLSDNVAMGAGSVLANLRLDKMLY